MFCDICIQAQNSNRVKNIEGNIVVGFKVNYSIVHVFGLGSVAQSDARSTGDQEGVSSRLRSGNILSLTLIMKSFLRSLSPFR